MFVLIGIGVLVSVVFFNGTTQSIFNFGFWRWVGVFFFLILSLPWIFGWRYGYKRPYYSGRYDQDPAFQALRERYSRGDISKEQFDQMASAASTKAVHVFPRSFRFDFAWKTQTT
jgi:uncharacterized membrane protein